jgi:hypothetical protein
MKYVFIAMIILIARSANSFSCENETKKKTCHSGLITTIKFVLQLQRFGKKKNIEDYVKVEELSIDLGVKTVRYRIGYKIVDPEFPTIVGHFGLYGNIDENYALSMAVNKDLFFPNYNLLLVDTLSSPWVNKVNCYYTLGGLDDAIAITNAISFYTLNTEMKENLYPTFYLIGGSSSSYSLFHTSILLSDSVKATYIQSGFNNVLRPIEYLNGRGENEKTRGFSFSEKIIASSLCAATKRRYNKSKSKCNKRPSEDFNYTKFLHDEYEHSKCDLLSIYNEIYPGKSVTSLGTYEEYYEKISLSNHLDMLDVPLLMVHAEDDPISNIVVLASELLSSGGNTNLCLEIHPDGGHGGFGVVYGMDWLIEKINDFFDSHR